MTFFVTHKARNVALLLLLFAIFRSIDSFGQSGQPMISAPNTAASAAANSLSRKPTLFVGPAAISLEESPSFNSGPSTTYTVTPTLGLEMKRYYKFTFNLEAETGVSSAVKLPDGFYKLRMVVALQNVRILSLGRKPTRLERYVTSKNKLVYYTNGKISTHVTFDFKDMTPLRKQLILYTQLIPIQQNAITIKDDEADLLDSEIDQLPEVPGMRAVVTRNFFTPVDPKEDHQESIPESIENDEIANNLTGYIKEVHESRPAPKSPVDGTCLANAQIDEGCYAKAENLLYVPTSSNYFDSILKYEQTSIYDVMPLNRDALERMFDVSNGSLQPLPDQFDPSVAKVICQAIVLAQQPGAKLADETSAWFYSSYKAWLSNCEAYPTAYLQFMKNVHIRQIMTEPVADAIELVTEPLQIISSVAASKAQTLNFHYGFTAGSSISAGLQTGYIGAQLLSIGVNTSMAETDYRSLSQTGTSQEYTTVRVQPVQVNIPVEQYRICISATVNPQYWAVPAGNKKGLYICDNEQYVTGKNRVAFPEIYYLAAQDTQDRPQAASQAINVEMRGDRDYGVFKGDVANYLGVMRDRPEVTRDTFARIGEAFMRYRVSPSGVISYPMMPLSEITDIQKGSLPADGSLWQRAKALTRDSYRAFLK